MNRKGIILAGGKGTRLFPSTKVMSKQLLPVFDKPMIYYPLSTLMLADIQEILVISTLQDISRFEELLGDGRRWGLKISYATQPEANGIAEALIIAEEFLNNSPSALILGDNIFYGHSLPKQLKEASFQETGATVFCYRTSDPERYGIVGFNEDGMATSIEEKPRAPKSNFAVTGLYFFDSQATEFAKSLTPSTRNELEITDLNNIYLELGILQVQQMGRGFAWLDTGTPESLIEASYFVQTIEKRQGLKIAVPEEIAFQKGWISAEYLEKQIQPYISSDYGKYLLRILGEHTYGNNGNKHKRS